MKKVSLAHVCLATFAFAQGCAVSTSGDEASSEATATDSMAIRADSPSAAYSVLATGAQLHGANGLATGPDGRLYVASLLGSEIAKVNRTSGAIVGRLGKSDGVDGPDDIAFGPDGSLYWTSLQTGNVVRRQPSGVVSQQFIAPGVNPITFSDNGRLFVALDFLGDALYELDPALVAPPRLIASGLGFLNGMDWGPDGRLYGPIWTQGRVVSIDVDSCTNATDPNTQCDIRTVATGFSIPAAVKFDSSGTLHAVDQNGDVVRINRVTGVRTVIAKLAPGLDNLVFGPEGELFVSSAADGFVVRIAKNGNVRTMLRGGAIVPGGVAVLPGSRSDSVYVADLFSLKEFDGKTGAARLSRPSFLGISPLQPPATVSADGSALLLTSYIGNTVQVLNPVTNAIVESYSDFAVPINAIRFQGDIVVSELGFTPGSARVVRRTAGGLVGLASLIVPSGLAASGNNLWAADWATGAIVQLVANGATLSPPRNVVAGLAAPEGLAVGADGKLLVVETGKRRLLRVDPSTGSFSVVAGDLAVGLTPATGSPPTFPFSGVAVGPSGSIYVSGDAGNLIYKFPR
jgi:sugar lactone lactonase YvrE